MNNDILSTRYPNIRAKAFIELSVQIQQLYDGPWVIVGDCPEEGCHNPNPQDQAKARSKWRNAYRMLKPYEKQIEEDFNQLDTIESPYIADDEAANAIRCMWEMCNRYHDVVELWDMTENPIPESQPQTAKEGSESTKQGSSNNYYEKLHNARSYFEASHSFFMSEIFPAVEENTNNWVLSLPDEERLEAIKKRKEALRNMLLSSDFFNHYPVTIPMEQENMVYEAFGTDEEISSVLSGIAHDLALEDIFDGIGVLNIDKVSIHMYDHQKDIQPASVSKFFKFIELTKVLNAFISTVENVDTFVADITGNYLHNPLFDTTGETDKQPEQVVYDMDKAMDYYEEKDKLFKDKVLPKLMSLTNRWWSRIPTVKQTDAIKGKIQEYENKFRRSGFLDNYCSEIPNDVIRDIYEYADDGDHAERCIEDTQYNRDMEDLYEGIDVLNLEKIERYVWVNQNRISDEQLFAYMTFEFMRKYLPTLLDHATTPKEELKQEPATSSSQEEVIIPAIFKEKLSQNQDIANKFVQIMVDVVIPKVKSKEGTRENKWRWPHVYKAFDDKHLDFISGNTEKIAFGRAIVFFDPSLKAKNIAQTFKNLKPDFPTVPDKNIITEVTNTFKPATMLLVQKS